MCYTPWVLGIFRLISRTCYRRYQYQYGCHVQRHSLKAHWGYYLRAASITLNMGCRKATICVRRVYKSGLWSSIPYSGVFSRYNILRFSTITIEPRKICASKSLFTVGLWSNESLSSKIKPAKCLSLSNPRNSASKITRYIGRFNWISHK